MCVDYVHTCMCLCVSVYIKWAPGAVCIHRDGQEQTNTHTTPTKHLSSTCLRDYIVLQVSCIIMLLVTLKLSKMVTP